ANGADSGGSELGGEGSPEDGRTSGGDVSWAGTGDRGAARGTKVRRVQSNVGIRSPRSQEHRWPAVADVAQCRTASGQPGVSTGHADDRCAFGGSYEAAHA